MFLSVCRAAEHMACREGTVVFDQSCFGKIVVSGFDAPAAMEWLCSNTTVAKNAGHSTYTCMLSESNGGGAGKCPLLESFLC
jgi:sarcosine dehydrogenase